MKVILLSDIERLGSRGTVVTVRFPPDRVVREAS